MWRYDSIVGTMLIKLNPANNKYQLIINDTVYGNYPSPIAAADDVYVHVTGCYEWDSLDGEIEDAPTDLSEWNKL